MAKYSNDNNLRFGAILHAIDACGHIQDQLNQVDQLNTVINDDHLSRLIEHANEISLELKPTPLRGPGYHELLSKSPELEPIVNLNKRLNDCTDDPNRFHEAIDILGTIEHLHKKYGHQVPMIETIYKQSERQRVFLVSNLCDRLELLKESPQNEAMLIVSHLVGCGNFSARELRLKYLQARDNWFNNECEEQSASFDNVVSVHCKGLPMIFNEYKSIFSSVTSEMMDKKLLRISSVDSDKEDGAIINSWLLLKASVFIASLEVYLDAIHQSGTQTPTIIADTMQKCFELTDWLSTIGFDFSSQLRPLFLRALVEEVKSSVELATVRFETSFAATATKSIQSLLLPVDDEILRISNMKPEEQLPKSIEHYPIFRIYCLYLIDSLRWLQTTRNTLSPINLCLVTYGALNVSLTRVMKALAAILSMDNNSTHPILSKIAISMVTEVLPFITNYCERLFPERIILSTIGLSKSEFKTIYTNEPEKLKNFRLDLKQIVSPLKGTLPALMQTLES